MTKHYTGKNWLEIVGKDKLQTFQDAFAHNYNVGMCFMDASGSPLTVSAQTSLLCHKIRQKNEKHCTTEHHTARDMVAAKKEGQFFTCSVGVSYFLCPVFWGEEIVAYAQLGCFISEQNNVPEKYIRAYNIPVFSTEQIKTIGTLLVKIVKLLNINYKKAYEVGLSERAQMNTIVDDARLSNREQQVVGLLCEGFNNKQISENLVISEKTVKSHISNILNKLGLRDRMQVVLYYLHGRVAG